jgi:hypothetical protein
MKKCDPEVSSLFVYVAVKVLLYKYKNTQQDAKYKSKYLSHAL